AEELAEKLSTALRVDLADDEPVELDDVADLHPGRLEVAANVLEALPSLLGRVVRHAAVLVSSDLARHGKPAGAGRDLDLMAVGAQRRVDGFRVAGSRHRYLRHHPKIRIKSQARRSGGRCRCRTRAGRAGAARSGPLPRRRGSG